MNQIISEISQEILSILLLDHTTQKNIIWATNDYSNLGEGYNFADEITLPKITANNKVISPRVYKSKEQQVQRTKSKAEVFTPSWVCNAQNNLIDDAWFGRENVFNTVSSDGKTWTATDGSIEFPKGKTWEDYVKANRMEITCGEAPYLVSRYDATTGENIPISQRIGLLDRKLRVVGENTSTLEEWLGWAEVAFKSIYGFEYQGDSLLIGRINLFKTFQEYLEQTNFQKEKVSLEIYQNIARIVSYNLWQMDGLTFAIPDSTFKFVKKSQKTKVPAEPAVCTPFSLIMDWEKKEFLPFKSLLKHEI